MTQGTPWDPDDHLRMEGCVVKPYSLDFRERPSWWSRFKGWLAWKLVDNLDITYDKDGISVTLNGIEKKEQATPDQVELLKIMRQK